MSKKKILIVDDEEGLCRSLKLNLEDTGDYEVQTTSKASEAMTLAYEFKPDLIILDFVMPEMDGAEVAQKLQADKFTQSIPFIFLTAIASKEDTERQGEIIGGNFFLAKPVTTEQLVDAIERNIKIKPDKGFLDNILKKRQTE